MEQIILVIHLLIAISLVVTVLIQRTEGGGLGLGGGGPSPLHNIRGSGNVLTRVTAFLAAGFMATSILLAILAGGSTAPRVLIDEAPIGEQAPLSPLLD